MGAIRILIFFSIPFLFVFLSCGQGISSGTGVTPPPTISGISSVPANDGTPRVIVTIIGSGFQEGSTVTISGVACTNVHIISSTQLTCYLPDGSVALVNVVITAPNGATTTPTVSSPFISTTAASVSTSSEWHNPTKALSDDGEYTDTDDSGDSIPIMLTGFFTNSFYTFPASAVIDGVKLNCRWYGTNTASKKTLEESIRLVVGGTAQGSNLAAGQVTSPMYLSRDIGGATELWGLSGTLTPSVVNSSDFGVEIKLSLDAGRDARIDYCKLAVYFH